MKNEELTFTITVDGTKVDLTSEMCIMIYQTYECAMYERREHATIMQLFERSLHRCCAYENAGQTFELINEIGILSGLSLALTAIGIYPSGEKAAHFLEAIPESIRNGNSLLL